MAVWGALKDGTPVSLFGAEWVVTMATADEDGRRLVLKYRPDFGPKKRKKGNGK